MKVRELNNGQKLSIPEMGEVYYYVTVHPSFGKFYTQQTTWNEYGSDKRRLVKGNLYMYKKHADAVVEKLNEMLDEL